MSPSSLLKQLGPVRTAIVVGSIAIGVAWIASFLSASDFHIFVDDQRLTIASTRSSIYLAYFSGEREGAGGRIAGIGSVLGGFSMQAFGSGTRYALNVSFAALLIILIGIFLIITWRWRTRTAAEGFEVVADDR